MKCGSVELEFYDPLEDDDDVPQRYEITPKGLAALGVDPKQHASHVEDTQTDAARSPKYTFEDNFDKWSNVERPDSVFHDEEL